MTRELPTIERLHDLFLLDLETGELTWRVSRGSRAAGQPALASVIRGHDEYRGGRVDRVNLVRSRVVFAMTRGRWPEGEVRRLDGDTLNDRPANLVDALTDPRGRSRPKRTRRVSKFVGVYWAEDRGVWVAKRCIDGRPQRLGQYATEEAAARAYDTAAPMDGSTYGNLRNFPEAAA